MTIYDDITTIGPFPSLQRDLLVLLLQELFTDADTINNAILKQYLWSADVTETAIYIDALERFDLRKPLIRPAVLVKYGGSKVIEPTLGKSYVLQTGTSQLREYWVQSAFEIRCLARNEREALYLASEIYIDLLDNAVLILDEYNLEDFQPQQQQGLQQIPEPLRAWMSPVIVETMASFKSTIDTTAAPDAAKASFDIG